MKSLFFFTMLFGICGSVIAQNSSVATKDCDLWPNKVKVVTLEDPSALIQTNIAVPADAEWNQKNPVLETTVKAKKGCIVVDFNALVGPTDNAAVFQVQLNGKPMEGHHLIQDSNNSIFGNETILNFPEDARKLIWLIDPKDFLESTSQRPIFQSISKTFFAEVAQTDTYTISVYYASCCSANSGAGRGGVPLVAPTLKVSYRR